MKIETALGAVRLDTDTMAAGRVLLDPPPRMWPRRLMFWGPVLCATIVGGFLAASATAGAPGSLRVPLIVLLTLTLLYFSVAGMPAIIGCVLHFTGRVMRATPLPSGLSRTAIVMPVYNEDPVPVFAAIEAMARAVAEAGLAHVDLFVLSDTQDSTASIAEQAGFDALLARMPPAGPGSPAVHYRRRAENVGRKAGNLAEFCDRWGASYDYMLVLDADSLMGASAIGHLIGLMDANPRAGIVQSVPYPVGRTTLFARLQQFTARLYAPLLIEGLNYWQQSDANYWGHNAIVRIAPFLAHCTLPVLPGVEPFGGEILCHDVVEAGLMRGAGWDVWMVPQVLESYEATPVNLVDCLQRERRWCQGNLQHGAVLPMPGFRPVGRFHLAYGIGSYLMGPAVLLFLALATVDSLLGGGFAAALFSGPAGTGFMVLGLAAMYGGKLATLLAVLADETEARRYGGRLTLICSAALEQISAMVMLAIAIGVQSWHVLDLLRGRTVRWDAQPRDDRGISWAEGWRRLRGPTVLGLCWLALLPVLPLLPPGLRLWTVPLLLTLLAICPLAVFSSRISLGNSARLLGLLLTPEERAPAPILRAVGRGSVAPADRPGLGLMRLVPSTPDAP